MENAIRNRRVHFSLLFCLKSDLGLSGRHLRGILGRLGKIFEPSWASTWVQLGPQDGSGAAQERPERSLQITHWASWSQEPPKSRPERSKTPPGRCPDTLQASILEHLGKDFIDKFDHFSKVLEARFCMQLSFEDSPLAVLGGLRLPRDPPCLEARPVAGTRLCRAEDNFT